MILVSPQRQSRHVLEVAPFRGGTHALVFAADSRSLLLGRFGVRSAPLSRPKVRGTAGYEFVEAISEHLVYLAVAGDPAKSLKTFERHARQGLTAASLLDRYFFFRAATLVLRRAASTGKPTHKVKLPEAFPARQESGQYALADLAAWFENEARTLAAAFDARAGNAYRIGQMNALAETAPKKERSSD